MKPTPTYTLETLTQKTQGLTDVHRNLYETVMALRELATRIADTPLDPTETSTIGIRFRGFADTLMSVDLLVESQQRQLNSLLGWAELLDDVNKPVAQKVYAVVGTRLDTLYRQREELSRRITQLTTIGENVISLAAPTEGQASKPYAQLLQEMTAEEQALSSVTELFQEGINYLKSVANHAMAVREQPEQEPETDYGALMENARDALENLLSERSQANASREAAEARAREAERQAREANGRAAEVNALYEAADAGRTEAEARSTSLEESFRTTEERATEAERLYRGIEETQTAVLAQAETAERTLGHLTAELEGLRRDSGLNSDTITALQRERDGLRERVERAVREVEDYRASEQAMSTAAEENACLRGEAERQEEELRQAYQALEEERERYRGLQSSSAATEARAGELAASVDLYQFLADDRGHELQRLRSSLREAGTPLRETIARVK